MRVLASAMLAAIVFVISADVTVGLQSRVDRHHSCPMKGPCCEKNACPMKKSTAAISLQSCDTSSSASLPQVVRWIVLLPEGAEHARADESEQRWRPDSSSTSEGCVHPPEHPPRILFS